MSPEENFLITNKTKGKLPSLPFFEMKEKILGKNYSLCLNFIGVDRIRALNAKYRKINKATDILSFPLSKTEGEIFICPKITKNEAVKFQRKLNNFFSFLFIHGLVHLSGYDHGPKMEILEKKYRNYFHI
ncbi:MAG: rRNA maturation RNase YbeY [Minisyncoccia bacterium]